MIAAALPGSLHRISGIALVLLASVVALGASAAVVSDDFSDPSGVLLPHWSTIDPLGDGTFQIQGVGTGDAQLAISVPAGTAHSVWEAGIDAPRVVQSVPDGDFEVHAEFESLVDLRYQSQGFVIEDGAGDFLLFDVFGRSGKNYIFAATISGGVATGRIKVKIGNSPVEPVHLRVARAGDTWTYYYSFDALVWIEAGSFTHAFSVSTVGVFAGNSGPAAPAHTALIDYVFDFANPIIPEDNGLDICGLLLNLTIVGSGSVTVDPDQPAYDCNEPVTLTAVPAPDFAFNQWSGNASGSTSPLSLTMTGDLDITAEFLSLFAAPIISNVQVLPLIDAARISWDTNEPATSRIDYGPSPAYEDGFVEDTTLARSHFIELTGLIPNSTVHYSISGTDADLLTSSTVNASFATLAIGADPSGIVSDDFSSGSLGLQWTITDPLGDSTVDLIGAGTPDAQLRIAIPAGVEHNAWAGANNAARVMQPTNDVDFEFEVKFESTVSQSFQIQGILIEESPGNYIRFDFFGDAGGMSIFAATFIGDAPTIQANQLIPTGTPRWMRVSRVGDQFTLSHSQDGVSFTWAASFPFPMTATSVGVFAATSGTNPPAHTALYDYAFSTVAPVAPEDGFAPCNHTLTVSTVGPGSVVVTPDQPTYDCNELVTLAAQPAGNQVFDSWSGDAGGFANPLVFPMTGNLSVTATFVPVPAPPLITAVGVTPGVDTATVTWQTDELATSRVDWGTDPAAKGSFVESSSPVTLHALQLTGLAAETLYHFAVTSVDDTLLSSTSPDFSFTTLPVGSDPAGIDSDDFSRNNLDTTVWTYADPGDDSRLRITGVGSSDATLDLELAPGVAQAVDGTSDNAPRVLQAANNADFSLELKLDSAPASDGQRQGILVEASGARLRFDLSHDGLGVRVGASSINGGAETPRIDVAGPSAGPVYLRVERTLGNWTLLHSTNGTSWLNDGSFQETVVVAAVGVFAANAPSGGGAAPGFTASVDFFQSDADPISGEDASVAPDALPPLVHAIGASPTDGSVELQWTTDEPSDSTVLYGATPAYELGSVSDASVVNDHVVTVTGLLPDTLYHFALRSQDGLAQSTTSGDQPVLTDPPPVGEGPVIEIFYGSIQSFGEIGIPQPWANVLGNVSDPDGVASLTYELNGGAARNLNLGPDSRRLADPGDFNADIALSDLVEGANTVLLRAADSLGNTSSRTVVANFTSANSWPENYSIEWNSVSQIQDVAQVVDGRWKIANGTLQNEQLNYDRLVALGDLTWDEYEVEVPLTMHGIDPGGFNPPSGEPAVGIILRWPGHRPRDPNEQPYIEFMPLGGVGWIVFGGGGSNKLQIFPNSGALANDSSLPNFQLGVTYILKFRVEQVVGVGGLYKLKAWQQGTPEPGWILEKQQTLSDPQAGSAVLVAHHVDADFGDVIVRQLGNLSPSAVDDAYGTLEDIPLTVATAQGVLANDTDPENDLLEARLLGDVSNGSLTLNLDGSFTYVPDPESSGIDSFRYEAFDGRSGSQPGTVTINVSAVADPPVVAGDAYGVSEDTTLGVDAIAGVLANDFDPEGSPLQALLETDVSSGSLALASDGSFTYTPAAGFSGVDSFTYRAFDGGLFSVPATVTIAVSNPPTAVDDAYPTPEDVVLVLPAVAGVLANDSDPEGDPLQALLATGPSNGTLALAPDGSFTYAPNPQFSGSDSFTYRATDGGNPSDPATVTLTVNEVPDPPVAVDDAYEVEPDGMLLVSSPLGVLGNDSDPEGQLLSAVLEQGTSQGALALLPDGSFSYTPNGGFSGVDSFTYRADDGGLLSNVATVALNVATTLTTGLVAHYPLDAGSGTVAGDASGNGLDGTLVGATWTPSTANGSPYAVEFDGVDDRIDVPSFEIAGQELTVAAWAYADDFDVPDARIFSKATGSAGADHVWMLSTLKSGGNRLRSRVSAGGATVTLVANVGFPKDTWIHAALTYDGTTARLYQDGVEVGSAALTGDLAVNPAAGIALGNQPLGAGDKAFDGFVDDARVYERALGIGEIELLAGMLPPAPDTEAPAAPTGVVVVPLSTASAELSWQDATDDRGVTAYRVLRDGIEVASGLTDTQFIDTALAAASSHSYTVRAEDEAGNLSLASAPAVAQTLAVGAPTWLDPTWAYRITIDVSAGGTARVNRPVEAFLDFSTELASVGQAAALDVNSLRVVRANASGQVLDPDVPFQFDPSVGFDPAANATGELVLQMEGTALGADARRYDVYFDVVGEGFAPAAVPPQVVVTSGVLDEGQLAFEVATPAGTWFFQEQGAALSSLVDSAGNDWIGYRIGGGSAGAYRGLPNLIFPESEFHPGGTDGITTVVGQGPLRLRLDAVTADGLWEASWSFYPEHATMTVERVGHNYWLLYEGTPGGALDPGLDRVVRSDGTQTLLGESWETDLVGEEWVYFHDPVEGRSLFLASHEDDLFTDSYRPLNGEMTVFGFGRSIGGSKLLDAAPRTFSFGLFESGDVAVAAKRIRSVVQPLAVSVGPIAELP